MTDATIVESLAAAAALLRTKIPIVPRVGLVLGSGLGGLADQLTDATRIPYGEIPGMPVSSVSGHAGCLVLGKLEGVAVVAMQGRVHLYEGHDPQRVVFGVRLMIELGAQSLILTNAAGGIRAGFQPGDLMLITDHLNLTGTSALLGPNDDALGPRFPDMSYAYDPQLADLARAVAAERGITLREGVYAGLLGPAYETPAEVRMLRGFGADAVGMSTVLEVMAARHRGASCLGISCITNVAAGLSEGELDHSEVEETAAQVRDSFQGLVRSCVAKLGTQLRS